MNHAVCAEGISFNMDSYKPQYKALRSNVESC